jgi:hypothetical protein
MREDPEPTSEPPLQILKLRAPTIIQKLKSKHPLQSADFQGCKVRRDICGAFGFGFSNWSSVARTDLGETRETARLLSVLASYKHRGSVLEIPA